MAGCTTTCNTCNTKQTFCELNGQLAKNNLDITFTSVKSKETYNLASIWNEIQQAMIDIYNFGSKGTKTNNPNITGLTNQTPNNYTTLEYYNNLLSRIQKTPLSETTYLKILDLQDYIKDYKLNSDRCDICNTGCDQCNTCERLNCDCGDCGDSCDSCGCNVEFCMDSCQTTYMHCSICSEY